jgi:hypothetical protein
MPKNKIKPSFKHYISKSIQAVLGEEGHGHNGPGREDDGPSVLERLSRSRAEAAPTRPRGDRGWNEQNQPLGAWGEEDRPVVPPSGRRAAGPAAPPSWRTVPTSFTTPAIRSDLNPDPGVTRQQLIEASSLLSKGKVTPPPTLGVASLTEYVFRTVIQYLDCEEVCWIDEDGSTTTYGEFLRKEVAEYDIRFKLGILASHSSYPTPRLSDKTVRSLLEPPGSGYSEHPNDTGHDDWDEGLIMPMVHHLSLTLHPTPHRLLKLMNPLPNIALTSLDLAYCNIPVQVEKFVSALPVGLKELGLAGVRCLSEKEFVKMLVLLGRRLVLLLVSHPS